VMAGESILQTVPIGAVFGINWSLHDHSRCRLGRNIGNLEMDVTIEADEPGILQICAHDVIEREFTPASWGGVRGVRSSYRPTENLGHGSFRRDHIG
jgi:hypothetical protein